jgi:hypothetical protein
MVAKTVARKLLVTCPLQRRSLMSHPLRAVARIVCSYFNEYDDCNGNATQAPDALVVAPVALPVGAADGERSTSEDCGGFRHHLERRALTNSDRALARERHSPAADRALGVRRRLT